MSFSSSKRSISPLYQPGFQFVPSSFHKTYTVWPTAKTCFPSICSACSLSFTGGLHFQCGHSLTFVFPACFRTLSFFTVGLLAFLLRFSSICGFVHFFSSSPILLHNISSFSATMALKGSRAIRMFCFSYPFPTSVDGIVGERRPFKHDVLVARRSSSPCWHFLWRLIVAMWSSYWTVVFSFATSIMCSMHKRSLEKAASGCPALGSPTLVTNSSLVPASKILCVLKMALSWATDNFINPALELGVDFTFPS